MNIPFLTCNWQNLVYINFKVDPKIIVPFLPADVEPVLIGEKTIVSIVCFQFSKAKFFEIPIPFHQFFPEINIRVYVQRKNNPDLNGVYFISEMTPKLMTVFVAKYIFGEPFSFKNIITHKTQTQLQYQAENRDVQIDVNCNLMDSSDRKYNQEEEFVINREFAFCGKAGKKSEIFRIQHRRWNVIELRDFKFSIERFLHIPKTLQNIFQTPLSSVFVTDGSEVRVFKI